MVDRDARTFPFTRKRDGFEWSDGHAIRFDSAAVRHGRQRSGRTGINRHEIESRLVWKPFLEQHAPHLARDRCIEYLVSPQIQTALKREAFSFSRNDRAAHNLQTWPIETPFRFET